MPLKKLSGPNIPHICRSPEHNPPNMIVLEPGTYEYTCPACGQQTVFTVPLVTMSAWALLPGRRKPLARWLMDRLS